MNSTIICPTCGTVKLEPKDDFLKAIFDTYPHLKKLADEIHNKRLLAGEACGSCIEAALIRILEQYEEAHK